MAYKPKVLAPSEGGTGIANSDSSTLTISGAFASTFTMTGVTTVTFPTSGTLSTTTGTVTSVSGTTNQVAVATGTTTPVISLVGPYTPATYTVHGVLIGEGTSSIVALAAGSAGQVLQSGGASADPAYSTSTYPTTNAVSTLLYASSANVMGALATANDGVLVTSHTGVPSILAGPGAAGKVLQSNTAAAPSYSTPTYPSASGTSRTILVSDGTNNVYSTETWAVPGTSSNVLTSDGTNWTSAAPATFVVNGTLTNAQIKALHATPIQILAAPGSGKSYNVIKSMSKMVYGGTNIFTAGAAQTIEAYYGTTTSATVLLSNAAIVAAASQIIAQGGNFQTQAYTVTNNVALNAYNPIATEITGNAGANNTMAYSIVYQIVTI